MNYCQVRCKSCNGDWMEYIREVTLSHFGLSLLYFSVIRQDVCSHIYGESNKMSTLLAWFLIWRNLEFSKLLYNSEKESCWWSHRVASH